MGATIYDLEEAELCYAPPFGSAKDPVNFAGMVAADVLRGDMPLSHWKDAKTGFLLDVREPIEQAVEKVPEAFNIPLGQLRGRLAELPRDREIHVICRSGQRAYYATRILLQNGFNAKVVSGGMLSLAHNHLIESDKEMGLELAAPPRLRVLSSNQDQFETTGPIIERPAGFVEVAEIDGGVTKGPMHVISINLTAAGLLLFEHAWAIGLKEAIKHAGGMTVAGGLWLMTCCRRWKQTSRRRSKVHSRKKQ